MFFGASQAFICSASGLSIVMHCVMLTSKYLRRVWRTEHQKSSVRRTMLYGAMKRILFTARASQEENESALIMGSSFSRINSCTTLATHQKTTGVIRDSS